jgi:hypothetical protein
MTFDTTELTDEYGATLTLEDRRQETGGILLTVRDETTAAIVLSYEQVRALANALIDAGF